MVQFEVWNTQRFTTERRTNLKYEDAVTTLNNLFGADFNIIRIDWSCPYTENRVMIRTNGDFNYHFRFTNKQMKNVMGLLVDLNNGNDLEKRWY